MRTLLVVILAVAAGCGGNDSVWSSSVSRLVLLRRGGFLPPSQPTAECPQEGVEYSLTVADRSLSAWRCTPGPAEPRPLIRTSVSRTLTTAELDALVPKLEAFRVVSVDSCALDAASTIVTVTTPSGVTEYGDSITSSCGDIDDRPTIEITAINAAAQAFEQLAF
ncbi:MAG: hypothetical protein ACREBE_08305, partial [bacterium]